MITVETLNSELPNVEMLYVICEEHIGMGNCFAVDIQRVDLETNQQTTYDNFVGLLGTTTENEILNAPATLGINRATSVAITEEVTQKDYNVDFDTTQQGYVSAFLDLIMELNDVE